MTYDFDGILEELEKRLSSKSEWRRTFFHGVYRRINVTIAYVLEKIVYLIEFYYKESSWDLATRIESLMARTEYYWYNPFRKTGAYGNVQVIADPTWEIDDEDFTYTGQSVIIPQWTRFSNEDEDVFVYSTERRVYYQNTKSHIDIPVKEGVPKEFLYIAEGRPSEQITLNFNSIDNAEIYVYLVNNDNAIIDTFIRCEQDIDNKLFFISDLNNYYCSIKNNLTLSAVIITFGDGIKTKQLQFNDRILIKYGETKGSLGNITNAYTITKILTPLFDPNLNEVELFTTNLTPILGGSNEEGIESIRNNASNLFNTGYRLGGYDDWKVILESDPRVFKAIIWSTDDHADDTLTLLQNKVFAIAINADGDEMDSTIKDDLEINLLKALKSPTELVQWESLKKVYAVFDIDVILKNIPFSRATTEINTAIDDNYSTLNTEFRQSIFESNHYNIVTEASTNIVNHTNTLYHLERVTAFGLTNHVIYPSVLSSTNSNLDEQVYLVPNTVSVWVRFFEDNQWQDPVRVGYESGGIIKGDNGYTITDSAVVHPVNTLSFFVEDLLLTDENLYELSFKYKTQDGNGRRQNDIRLYYFDTITDTDSSYNNYTFEYE